MRMAAMIISVILLSEELRVVVLDCFEEFLLRLIHFAVQPIVAIGATMRLSILEGHMVAESYLAVFAEIRRGVFIFHAHVAVEFELYFFKFFDAHTSVLLYFASYSMMPFILPMTTEVPRTQSPIISLFASIFFRFCLFCLDSDKSCLFLSIIQR